MGIITISGNAGAGKSTVGRLLAKKLKLHYYDLGFIRRQMAKEHNMTLAEFNKLGETKFFTDKEVDEHQRKLGIDKDNFVMVSRLGFHFIPNSVKVFLKIDENEASKRIFLDKKRRKEEEFQSQNEALIRLQTREKSDLFRYGKYYKLNPYEPAHYDLVIDTSKITPDQVVKKIIFYLKKSKFTK